MGKKSGRSGIQAVHGRTMGTSKTAAGKAEAKALPMQKKKSIAKEAVKSVIVLAKKTSITSATKKAREALMK